MLAKYGLVLFGFSLGSTCCLAWLGGYVGDGVLGDDSFAMRDYAAAANELLATYWDSSATDLFYSS